MGAGERGGQNENHYELKKSNLDDKKFVNGILHYDGGVFRNYAEEYWNF